MTTVAKGLGLKIGGKGQVGLLVGSRGNYMSDTRERAFMDVMKKEFPEIQVIGTKGIIDLDVRDHGLRILSKDRWGLPDVLHWPETNGRITGDLFKRRTVRDLITHHAPMG